MHQARNWRNFFREQGPSKHLWDRIEYYEKLPSLKHTFLDEILLLVEQLIGILENKPASAKARQGYKVAKSLVSEGKRIESAEHAVKANDILYF